MERYDQAFIKATGFTNYHQYQVRLACGSRGNLDEKAWLSGGNDCKSMLIDIPTGFGKTSAVVLAWLWNRELNQREDWPRRLVYCLPMRALVEQTCENVERWLNNLDLTDKVNVHLLMGGEDAGEWDIHPERNAILIGTQDMLLSRALNRGYGMKRYRWPMHFGLLNNDALWVMDEVQLMGPGLWTSAQLDWMRNKRFGCVKPCVTWWMSATIGTSFLNTLDRQNDKMPEPSKLSLENETSAYAKVLLNAKRPCVKPWKVRQRCGADSNEKLNLFAKELASRVIEEHQQGSLSLVVCNTVKLAQLIYKKINKANAQEDDNVVLITSRFRPRDRQSNQDNLLEFERHRKEQARASGDFSFPGLICVSTQVIEAGLDVSARRLWSEVAPWPCVVQRLGRLNRDGLLNDEAAAYFWEADKTTGKQQSGPYKPEEIKLGRSLIEKLAALNSQDPNLSARSAMNKLKRWNPEDVKNAIMLQREQCPRAIDVHGLFSTESDIFGGFTDVSPYIRNQDRNSDVTVFWRAWDTKKSLKSPLAGLAFKHDEGCAVALHRLTDFLGSKGVVWTWGEKTERWERIRSSELCPGMLLMLPALEGGYSEEIGWTGNKAHKIATAEPPPMELYETSDADPLTESGYWVELKDHLQDAECEAKNIVRALDLEDSIGRAVVYASSKHDVGKATRDWQRGLPSTPSGSDKVWAKAPARFEVVAETEESAKAVEVTLTSAAIHNERTEPWYEEDEEHLRTYTWAVSQKVRRDVFDQIRFCSGVRGARNVQFRPGLRHEAASALALWYSYYRMENRGFPALSIYLAAAHHGKVRTTLRSWKESGEDVFGIEKSASPLTLGGETLELDFECSTDGAAGHFSEDGSAFIFEAPSWTGLVADLLGGWEAHAPQRANGAVPKGEPGHLGPFRLAYLETLVRCADAKASITPNIKREIG